MISEDDEKKINSLNWLKHDNDKNQKIERLIQMNSLLNYFILNNKIKSSNHLYEKFPINDILESKFELNNEITFSLSENNFYYQYLKILNMNLEWGAKYNSVKTVQLNISNLKSSIMKNNQNENSSSNEMKREMAKLNVFSIDLEKMLQELMVLFNVIFENPILFDNEINQKTQIVEVKKKCIPNLFFLYYELLFNSKKYDDWFFLFN
jgi:hypothetical protein